MDTKNGGIAPASTSIPRTSNFDMNAALTAFKASDPYCSTDDTRVLQDCLSFEEVVKRYYAPVYKRAYFLMRNRENAEDVCQQTFLQAWNAFPRLTRHDQLHSWLWRIVTNVACDYRRYKLQHTNDLVDLECAYELPDAQAHDPYEVSGRDELEWFTRSAWRNIQPCYRRILAYLAQGYRPREIAHEIGASETETRRLLRDARATFKRHYRGYQEVAV